MKNCTRLDLETANTIKVQNSMNTVLEKKGKKTIVASADGKSLASKLGKNWIARGNKAELSSSNNGIGCVLRVEKNKKDDSYSCLIRLNTQNINSNSKSLNELKSGISDALLSVVRSAGEIGSKLD